MRANRLDHIPGFSIDRVAAAAGDDPDVLRLENLDTDLRPPPEAIDATRLAIDDDDANSYLPFTGQDELRIAAAAHVTGLSGIPYDPFRNTVITAGGTEGLLNVLLATVNSGDEVIMTDPTYAGMVSRVRLAAGTPRLIPFREEREGWRLDLHALRASVTDKSRVMFVMNPSMPSGAVLNQEEWSEIAGLCVTHDMMLLYNAAMERILFDDLPYCHPASLPGMADRTVTVGSVSKEYRMIGWRTGWVVGPGQIIENVARVSIYNVVTPVGLAQGAAAAALRTGDAGIHAAVKEWEHRRDVVLEELAGYHVPSPCGGWSLLLDVGALGLDSFSASERLLRIGRIAATPMRDWGNVNSDQYVRLVFSNETQERLNSLGERVKRSLGSR